MKYFSPLILIVLLLVPWSAARAQDGLSDSAIKELRQYSQGDERRRDHPPPVDKPEFVKVSDASLYLDPNDVVFVEEPLRAGDTAFIYPQNILVIHEVVNVGSGDDRRSVTYSPLTGTVVGYYGRADGKSFTLGLVGVIINNNRVLYDRATGSQWPQIMGVAIRGPLKGRRLDRFPLLWTRWKLARKRWPNALVLSRETGYRHSYNKDQYGSYLKSGTYYDSGGAYYPLSHTDPSIHPKERVLGVALGESALAFIEAEVKKSGVASAEYGLTPVVAIYDPGVDAVRVFHAVADGRNLHFEMAGDSIVDKETRSHWDVMGRAVEGRLRGMVLERAAAEDSMWFAWKAFYPYTEVWGRPGAEGSGW